MAEAAQRTKESWEAQGYQTLEQVQQQAREKAREKSKAMVSPIIRAMCLVALLVA